MPQTSIAAIGRADGRPLLDLVAGEVGKAEAARIGRMAVDCRHDVAGDLAVVERVGAASGDRLQRVGIGLVGEQRADRQRRAGGIEEIGARRRLLVEPAEILADRHVHPRRHA